MTIAEGLALLGSVTGIMALIITAWKDRNKPRVDLSQVERDEAEIDKLRHEITKDILAQTALERERMQSEIDGLRHDFKVVMTFARDVWSGSKRLHAQVVSLREEPVYVPPADFPTGPLGAIKA